MIMDNENERDDKPEEEFVPHESVYPTLSSDKSISKILQQIPQNARVDSARSFGDYCKVRGVHGAAAFAITYHFESDNYAEVMVQCTNGQSIQTAVNISSIGELLEKFASASLDVVAPQPGLGILTEYSPPKAVVPEIPVPSGPVAASG
jgi:hypothetical protein